MEKFVRKLTGEVEVQDAEEMLRRVEKDPCFVESNKFYKCLNERGKEEKCEEYIDNFQKCRSFWRAIKLSRLKQGTFPLTPPLEERQQVFNEHLRKMKGEL